MDNSSIKLVFKVQTVDCRKEVTEADKSTAETVFKTSDTDVVALPDLLFADNQTTCLNLL